MSLSEQEQRTLREIEESLLADDPKFGASVSEPASFGGSGGAVTLRGVALVVVGLCMLIGGVALAQQSLWFLSLIHISEPTRLHKVSRMPSSA